MNQQLRDQVLANAIGTAGDRAVGVYVNLLDAKAQTHTLDGDTTGGGHRPGTRLPGKSEFPAGWSDQKILHDISDVAADPNSKVTKQGHTTLIEGRRGGVDIRVVERDGRNHHRILHESAEKSKPIRRYRCLLPLVVLRI